MISSRYYTCGKDFHVLFLCIVGKIYLPYTRLHCNLLTAVNMVKFHKHIYLSAAEWQKTKQAAKYAIKIWVCYIFYVQNKMFCTKAYYCLLPLEQFPYSVVWWGIGKQFPQEKTNNSIYDCISFGTACDIFNKIHLAVL